MSAPNANYIIRGTSLPGVSLSSPVPQGYRPSQTSYNGAHDQAQSDCTRDTVVLKEGDTYISLKDQRGKRSMEGLVANDVKELTQEELTALYQEQQRLCGNASEKSISIPAVGMPSLPSIDFRGMNAKQLQAAAEQIGEYAHELTMQINGDDERAGQRKGRPTTQTKGQANRASEYVKADMNMFSTAEKGHVSGGVGTAIDSISTQNEREALQLLRRLISEQISFHVDDAHGEGPGAGNASATETNMAEVDGKDFTGYAGRNGEKHFEEIVAPEAVSYPEVQELLQQAGVTHRSETDVTHIFTSHLERNGPLPEGWIAMEDPKTKEYFYVNHAQKLKSTVYPSFDFDPVEALINRSERESQALSHAVDSLQKLRCLIPHYEPPVIHPVDPSLVQQVNGMGQKLDHVANLLNSVVNLMLEKGIGPAPTMPSQEIANFDNYRIKEVKMMENDLSDLSQQQQLVLHSSLNPELLQYQHQQSVGALVPKGSPAVLGGFAEELIARERERARESLLLVGTEIGPVEVGPVEWDIAPDVGLLAVRHYSPQPVQWAQGTEIGTGIQEVGPVKWAQGTEMQEVGPVQARTQVGPVQWDFAPDVGLLAVRPYSPQPVQWAQGTEIGTGIQEVGPVKWAQGTEIQEVGPVQASTQVGPVQWDIPLNHSKQIFQEFPESQYTNLLRIVDKLSPSRLSPSSSYTEQLLDRKRNSVPLFH